MIPGCCICDPATCAADDTGEHCTDMSCGVCLHGCPAAVDQTCCLDEPAEVSSHECEGVESYAAMLARHAAGVSR
ncbi:hypothetical protein ACQSSU_06765 [Micromonospora echinospora]